ncbi:DUF1295 domain-containing protein [Streptomyces roseus]|uniref:DUF1295 domain-containing protein n=1 Tax=Streptomyces roseus TaxID=66430 RepID=UPI001FD729FB|nr:DUF1295 domain-containing protein [Streptomyces roseus]
MRGSPPCPPPPPPGTRTGARHDRHRWGSPRSPPRRPRCDGGGGASRLLRRGRAPRRLHRFADPAGAPLLPPSLSPRLLPVGHGSVPLGLLASCGIAVLALGLGFEAVGDHQPARFDQGPAHRGRTTDQGLLTLTPLGESTWPTAPVMPNMQGGPAASCRCPRTIRPSRDPGTRGEGVRFRHRAGSSRPRAAASAVPAGSRGGARPARRSRRLPDAAASAQPPRFADAAVRPRDGTGLPLR